jgi:hypothetical protein
MLYHVTDKDSGIEIWNNGLKSNTAINNNRTRRKNMRKDIDEIASKKYDNYVPRTNAIFAWSTFEAAERYASSNYTTPAIVEFEIKGDAWCVEEYVSEDLYRNYKSDESKESVENVVEYYRQWDRQRNDELEVWLQQSSVGKVTRVVDEFGNPF